MGTTRGPIWVLGDISPPASEVVFPDVSQNMGSGFLILVSGLAVGVGGTGCS